MFYLQRYCFKALFYKFVFTIVKNIYVDMFGTFEFGTTQSKKPNLNKILTYMMKADNIINLFFSIFFFFNLFSRSEL